MQNRDEMPNSSRSRSRGRARARRRREDTRERIELGYQILRFVEGSDRHRGRSPRSRSRSIQGSPGSHRTGRILRPNSSLPEPVRSRTQSVVATLRPRRTHSIEPESVRSGARSIARAAQHEPPARAGWGSRTPKEWASSERGAADLEETARPWRERSNAYPRRNPEDVERERTRQALDGWEELPSGLWGRIPGQCREYARAGRCTWGARCGFCHGASLEAIARARANKVRTESQEPSVTNYCAATLLWESPEGWMCAVVEQPDRHEDSTGWPREKTNEHAVDVDKAEKVLHRLVCVPTEDQLVLTQDAPKGCCFHVREEYRYGAGQKHCGRILLHAFLVRPETQAPDCKPGARYVPLVEYCGHVKRGLTALALCEELEETGIAVVGHRT